MCHVSIVAEIFLIYVAYKSRNIKLNGSQDGYIEKQSNVGTGYRQGF
jgi:hypothetical protein